MTSKNLVKSYSLLPLGVDNYWKFHNGANYVSYGWVGRYKFPTLRMVWTSPNGYKEYTHIFNDPVYGLGDAGAWKTKPGSPNPTDNFNYSPPKTVLPPLAVLPYSFTYQGFLVDPQLLSRRFYFPTSDRKITIKYSWTFDRGQITTPKFAFDDSIKMVEDWGEFQWVLWFVNNIGIVKYNLVIMNQVTEEGLLVDYKANYSFCDLATIKTIEALNQTLTKEEIAKVYADWSSLASLVLKEHYNWENHYEWAKNQSLLTIVSETNKRLSKLQNIVGGERLGLLSTIDWIEKALSRSREKFLREKLLGSLIRGLKRKVLSHISLLII
jgi:hypothetical protein